MSSLPLRVIDAPSSIEETISRSRLSCLKVLTRFRIPPEDAEDLLQDAFLLLIKKGDEVRNPELWLPVVLGNLCRHHLRSRRRERTVAVDSSQLEQFADERTADPAQREREHDLELLLERMPEPCRTLLRLRYQLELDPSEIARRLGCRPTSIRKMAQRCLERLASQRVRSG